MGNEKPPSIFECKAISDLIDKTFLFTFSRVIWSIISTVSGALSWDLLSTYSVGPSGVKDPALIFRMVPMDTPRKSRDSHLSSTCEVKSLIII